MEAASPPARPAPFGAGEEARPGFPRLLRLSAAVTATGHSAQKLRSLQMSGIFLALSGVGSVLAVSHLGAADVGDIVALRILAYSCWLYGGLGLWALLSPKSLFQHPSQLAKMRGQEMGTTLVRGLGFARRLILGMLLASLPGLLTALIVSPTMGTVLQRTLLLVVATLYLVSLGLVLGALGAFCASAFSRAPRSAALALVLGPFLLSFVAEEVPSIIGIYSWGLSEMIAWGAL